MQANILCPPSFARDASIPSSHGRTHRVSAVGNQPNRIHHTTAESLQTSARYGCRICSAVWERRSRLRKDFVRNLMFWKPATTFRVGGGLRISYKEDPTQSLYDCAFQLHEVRVADRWAGLGQTVDIRQRLALKDLSTSTASDESLELAGRWIQNCTIHHGLCCANQDRSFRPSRLLYLDNNSVRIHAKREMPPGVSYLTLSHCWGNLKLIKLLQCNEDEFQHDIPWSNLPRTFRDAIRITRHVGFSYLWIDSLCIIQDSIDDWKYEARLMGKIYKNVACNIAASDASDSRYGCLYPRNPRTLQPEAVYLSSGSEQYLTNETDIYDDHILYTRAWVLQEALLARRTIDCGRGQLFWRCGEMRASEVFPIGVPTNIHQNDHPVSKFKAIWGSDDQIILNVNVLEQSLNSHRTRSQIPPAPGRGSVEWHTSAPFAFWASIVRYYTEMKLTKDTDRTIAFGGIIDVFRPFFGEHWFGMWRIFMPLELLWVSQGRMKQPSTPRAPSWPWLSLEGPVSYGDCEFKLGRDILVTKLIDTTTIGEHGMRLCLSTPLIRAKCAVGVTRALSSRAFISSVEDETFHLSYRGIPITSGNYGEAFFDRWADEDSVCEEDVFCMCIQIHKAHHETKAKGLLLRKIENGVFERLGHFIEYDELMIPFFKSASRVEIFLE